MNIWLKITALRHMTQFAIWFQLFAFRFKFWANSIIEQIKGISNWKTVTSNETQFQLIWICILSYEIEFTENLRGDKKNSLRFYSIISRKFTGDHNKLGHRVLLCQHLPFIIKFNFVIANFVLIVLDSAMNSTVIFITFFLHEKCPWLLL